MLGMTTERTDGVLCVRVSGRVDSARARGFGEAVRMAVEDNDRAVVLDFEEVAYISSAGLQAVLMIARDERERNARFSLCSLSDPVRRVFEVSGFHRIITTHRSRDEAVAAVDT